MADVKAKAEARRAKILARDSAKKVVTAINEEEEVLINIGIGPSTPKERPIAARRSLVLAKSEDKLEDFVKSNEGDDALDTPNKSNQETGKDIDKDSENAKDNDKKVKGSEDSENKTEKGEEKKSKLPPPKSMEEIEREVAENTAKFDELHKDSSTKKSSKATKVALTKKVDIKTNIDATSTIRLLRFVGIVLLAVFSGYRTVQKSRMEAENLVVELSNKSALNQEQDEFGSTLENAILQEPVAIQRTWGQYFVQRFTNQFESSLSAAGFIWWIARMVSPSINSQFQQKQKSSKPMEMVMEFIQTGFSGLKEGVYTTIGEVALHLFTVIATVTIITMYYSSLNNGTDSVTPAVGEL